jgi:cysteinyl-tRNA synthetase
MTEHKIKVYNTLTQRKEVLVPAEDRRIRIYACGPTVYGPPHLGHARSALTFDIIRRFLRKMGYEVTYVRNFTDIDDKIIQRAKEMGVSPAEVAEKYTREYTEDMEALGLEKPDFEPRVTENIPEIIELIGRLIEKGYAYAADGDVFFSVKSFPGYGKLSKRSLEDMLEGARVEVSELKRDPLDFALWKGAKPGEPSWESPWGPGRPGWHIECSAMSMKYLGECFDIHGGGKDLIFPHHENEIAQSEASTGREFARYWVHNGLIEIEREKMSKSIGNIVAVRDAIGIWGKEALRLFFLSHHYQNPADFSTQAMEEAEAALERIYLTLARVKSLGKNGGEDGELAAAVERFRKGWVDAMSDDFNTAQALGCLFELVKSINRSIDAHGYTKTLGEAVSAIGELGELFGILELEPDVYLKREKLRKRGIDIAEEEIERLIEERAKARREKNWARADEIRRHLAEKGITLEDTPSGTLWRVGS